MSLHFAKEKEGPQVKALKLIEKSALSIYGFG